MYVVRLTVSCQTEEPISWWVGMAENEVLEGLNPNFGNDEDIFIARSIDCFG